MQFDPHSSDWQRRILTSAGVATIALSLTFPSHAGDDTDVDLKPADFVPEEPIAIRVDALQPSSNGSMVSFTVLNRTNEDAEQVVECTLYDVDRGDLGIATSSPFRAVAKRETAASVTGAEAAKFVECLVRAAK